MNDDQIEDLLRKAPGPTAPAGLAERLKQQIRLPPTPTPTGRFQPFESRRRLMRWLPAFSVVAFFLACVVAIGVQTSLLTGLRHDNENLRAAAVNLDQLRAAHLEYQRLQAASYELAQLRKDHDDLLRLRNEVAQLRADAQEADKLRVDNQKLQSNNAALQARLTPGGDPLGASLYAALQKEKDQAERAACANNLKQIGLAAKMFEVDHAIYPRKFSDFMPSGSNSASISDGLDSNVSFQSAIIHVDAGVTNFIRLAPGATIRTGFDQPDSLSWKMFQCPGDKSTTLTGWPDVVAGKSSYVFAPQGYAGNYPDSEIVFMYCPIHHIYLVINGSVQMPMENGKEHIKQENGWTLFVP